MLRIFTSTYDARNALHSLAEPGGKLVTYAYDPASRRVSMDAYGKGVFTYVYDAAGQQTQVTTPQLQTTTIGYDPVGRIVERAFSSGASTTQTYGGAGNLSGITNNGASVLVLRLAYTYDKANHRLTQIEDDGTVTTWTYDGAYQLTNEDRAGGPTNTSFNLTHSYDPAGNRITLADGTTVTTFTYSAANRLILADAAGELTTYTYDLAGNRTGEQPSSGPSQSYAWDAAGQMTVAEVEAGADPGIGPGANRLTFDSSSGRFRRGCSAPSRGAAVGPALRLPLPRSRIPEKNRRLSDG